LCRMRNSKGTVTKQIALTKTDVPQPSVKTGRVVAAASTAKSWSMLTMSLLTLVFCAVKIVD
jgi:hypothetical protein